MSGSSPQKLGAFSFNNALPCLFRAAEKNLSAEELDMLTGAADMAAEMAADASKVAAGLAFLIGNDQSAKRSNSTGFFDNETHAVLLHLSSQFDAIAGLIALGQEAQYRIEKLKQRAQIADEGAEQ